MPDLVSFAAWLPGDISLNILHAPLDLIPFTLQKNISKHDILVLVAQAREHTILCANTGTLSEQGLDVTLD